MKTFIAALALATALVSPAFAQSSDLLTAPAAQSARTSPYNAYNAVTPFGSPGGATSAARGAAIQACSNLAGAYKENTWGSMQIQQYRSCMAQHGQAE